MLGSLQREMEALIAPGVNKQVGSGQGSEPRGKGTQGTLLREGYSLQKSECWAEVTHFLEKLYSYYFHKIIYI